MKRLMFVLILWAGLASIGAPSVAQQASAELRRGAEQIVALLRGEGDPATVFTSAFLQQVPAAQVRALFQQLSAQYGAVRGLAGIEPSSAREGVFHVDYERALVHLTISLDPQEPRLVNGLYVTGADVRGDSLAAIMDELRALPGQTSVAVARLGGAEPEILAGIEPDGPLAVGSAFKLFLLAELSRQVQAGERRWTDVVALQPRGLPGGTLANWPAGSPITLHSLAALMISQSDNRATDELLRVLGRENAERMMTRIGVRAAERNRPMISTAEMFALKTASDEDHRAWVAGDEAARRRLLATRYADPRPDASRFTGAPNRIDSVEWFASAADLVRTMDWLRVHGDPVAHAILSINPAASPTLRSEFAFIGYKGGSEPGVLNFTWLVRNRAGVWHVITGSWNNPAAAVDDARLAGPLGRAFAFIR